MNTHAQVGFVCPGGAVIRHSRNSDCRSASRRRRCWARVEYDLVRVQYDRAQVRDEVTVHSARPPSSKTSRGAQPVVHLDGDVLHDRPQDVLWVTSATCAAMAAVVHLIPQTAMLPATISVASAYIAADFASGVYHWAVDNYGSRETPVFGEHIAAFQGHHASPWTIVSRGFFNNVSKACKPALPQLALLALAPVPPVQGLFYTTFLVSVILAQEFHKWSHMIRPPPVVQALQETGLLISRKAHGAHHSSPFEGDYCILSGICNGTLDHFEFFRRLEVFFYLRNGAEPKCWHLNPDIKYQALQKYS